MEAIEWLEQQVFGFRDLSRADRTAINHFHLLWSFFESRVLDNNANAGAILEAMRQMAADGRLDLEPLAPALAYFRNRYVQDGEPTYHFEGLLLRGEGLRGDKPDLVRAVLMDQTNDPAEIAAGVLIIVYRFKNNLVHGMKWAYAIQDQRPNFRHATRVLMAVMDMWGVNRGA
jgi:hypothetical protein